LAQEIGRLTLLNAGLNQDAFDSFHLQLRANGWIQDLGKVSSHFQQMVSGAPQIEQLLRHETISGLLMFSDSLPFRKWLGEKFSDEVLLTFLWSAMGHHRKFDKLTKPELTLALTATVSHSDFKTILREMGEDLRLSSPPALDHDLVIAQTQRDKCDIGAREALRDLQDEFLDAEDLFNSDSARRRLALVKGLGIGADVAASAIAFHGQSANNYSIRDFVAESLSVGLTSQDLKQIITQWAWNRSAIERANEGEMPADVRPRPFQVEVANAKSHLTFAEAGCGSGKSLAAYMWAHEWCRRIGTYGRNNFRLFFCLPTTGTTTEHFKDYALESGIDPKLMSLTHSRASIDLRAIAETAPQEESVDQGNGPASAAQDALHAEKDKIQALALWSTPLVVTTTDTVLGLMVNARRSIYSLPALMCGAFVFDEIHAFDDQLFGHLLVFLKNFPKLPVLLMTASLPKQRLDALKRVRPDVACIPGPPEFEELKRYVIQEVSDLGEVHDAIQGCLTQGGKVLWVRNRVEWANQTYTNCRERFDKVVVNVYHSRLRYKDRSIRHRRVIDAFTGKNGGAILVATQVAEMSLDLSADLLVTDLAPISSLIQRMGRLNRRLTSETPEKERSAKPALICHLSPTEPKVELPYDTLQLETAKKWIAALLARKEPLSQRDLSEGFGQFNEEKEFDLKKAEQLACFFSGLWQTRPGNTRGEGHTISVILEGDKEEWERKHPNAPPTSEWLREHEVSIPIRDEALKWERLGGLRVAPRDAVAYEYDESTHEGTGARWRRK
jgi:CRISPR-associated endonuclease/helicase Cas3